MRKLTTKISRSACVGLFVGLVSLVFLRCGSPKRPNILLVSIDALRADHVGAYGYPRETTPFIDSLARGGTVFRRAFVPLPATDPSHASLFTSLHPLEHGVKANARPLSEKHETLAEVLRKAGYFTMGAVASLTLQRYGLDRGFDVYSDDWVASAEGNNADRRDASSVNEGVLRMIDAYLQQRRLQPYFLFVHYFDVHAPYRRRTYPIDTPAAVVASAREYPESADLIDRYDSGVRYVDRHVRKLYSYLQAHGLAENLLTIVTSDHGEQLGEHGYFGGHADMYWETIRVPLLFHGPDVAPSWVGQIVSSMDTAVTILSGLGLAFENPVSGVNQMPDRLFFQPVSRPLIILGYPTYTRSVQLIDQELALIHNLDHIYQDVVVEYDPERTSEGHQKDFQTLTPSTSKEQEAVYPVPLPTEAGRLLKLFVTVDARLTRPECEASINVRIDPGIAYLENPVAFRESIRLHYPASTRDRTSVLISPGQCIDEVVFRPRLFEQFDRDHRRLTGSFNTLETILWRNLLTQRKRAPGDELYDLAGDPAMHRNLVSHPRYSGEAKRLPRLLDETFFETWQRGSQNVDDPRSYTEKEIELLRSLGYIQ